LAHRANPFGAMLTRHQPASLQTYESLARKGEAMTTAAMVTYAFDRIEQARAELESGLEIDDIRESQYFVP
jgi:hypothetical protein